MFALDNGLISQIVFEWSMQILHASIDIKELPLIELFANIFTSMFIIISHSLFALCNTWDSASWEFYVTFYSKIEFW